MKEFKVIGTTVEIPIESLKENPNNARDKRDYLESDPAMQDLMRDIELRGVITDLVVEKMNNDKYMIIFGHRRYHASKFLDLDTLPCKISTFENAEEILYQQISENVVRKMPDPKSRGEQFIKLMNETPGLTAADIERQTGAKDVAACIRSYKLYLEGVKRTSGKLEKADNRAKERPDYATISKAVYKRALVPAENKVDLLEAACDENVTGHHVEAVIQDLQKMAKMDIKVDKKTVKEMVKKAKETDEHNIIVMKNDWDFLKEIWSSLENNTEKPATFRHFFIDLVSYSTNEIKKEGSIPWK